MIRLNRGVKGMGVCFGIYTMYFTLGRNSRMIARSGKKYKSQPVSEESMEAVLKTLMEDRQKREQELMTQQAAEELRRNEERVAQRRAGSARAARRSMESGAERNAGAYANYGGDDEDVG